MRLLWKNMLKSFFRNKIELGTLTILITIVTIVIIGLSGFIIFLQTQNSIINKDGFSADASINISPGSPKLQADNQGDLFGDFEFSLNKDVPQYIYQNPTNSESSASHIFLGTINYVISHGGIGNGTAAHPFGKSLGTYAIDNSDDRIFENSSNGSNSGSSTLFKVVGLENYFDATNTNGQNNSFKLNANCFSDFFNSTASNNLANSYAYNLKKTSSETMDKKDWNGRALTNVLASKSDKTNDQFGGIKMVNFGEHKKFSSVNRWINRPILLKGKFTNSIHDIDISYQYAKYHHINIGDSMNVNSSPYKVVGFAISPKYIYPQFSPINLTPDNRQQCIVYTQRAFYDTAFGRLFGARLTDREAAINIKILTGNKTLILNKLQSQFNFIKQNITGTAGVIGNDDTIIKGLQDFSFDIVRNNSYVYANRVNFISKMQYVIFILTIVFSAIIFIAALFSLMIIIRKQTLEDSKKLGVLKALGYNSITLSTSYVVVPLFISIISVIMGFVASILFWGLAITIFSLYLNFDLASVWSVQTFSGIFSNSIMWIVLGLVVPVVFTVIFAFYITYINIRQKTVDLLYIEK